MRRTVARLADGRELIYYDEDDVRKAPWSFDIDRRGRYVLCAWVQEGSSDLFPEAAASFRFRVR